MQDVAMRAEGLTRMGMSQPVMCQETIGSCRLILGDCLAVLQDLPGISVGAIVTDPPYGVSWKRGAHRGQQARHGILGDSDTSVRDDLLNLFPDIPAIVFGSFYAPFPPRLKQVLVWHKPRDAGFFGARTGFRRDAEPIFLVGPWPKRNVSRSSVIQTTAGISSYCRKAKHPHAKPINLLCDLLRFAPPIEKAVILDPFMGSGSVGLACLQTGHDYIGIEKDPQQFANAVRRLKEVWAS